MQDAAIKVIGNTTDNKLQNQGSPNELLGNIEKNSVMIRGVKSSDSVVIVLDGKVFSENINKIDPNTIKTVSVIKDNATAYLNQITGSNASADGKLKGLIVISTTGDANGAISITPGANNVQVVGYGSNNIAQPQVYTVDPTTTRLRLRGAAAGQNAPLILVDGKEFSSIEGIDPNNIESASILKDASSVSAYGEKAKHGVIIITLKKIKNN